MIADACRPAGGGWERRERQRNDKGDESRRRERFGVLLRVGIGIGDASLRKVLVFVTTGLGRPCDGKTGRSGVRSDGWELLATRLI